MMHNSSKICSLLLGALLLSIAGCGSSSSTAKSSPPPPEVHNEWTWIDGANGPNDAPGTYGPRDEASFSYTPGARDYPVSWTDASGNFWLFGGNGIDSAHILGPLNDLWKYGNGEWIWVSGSNQAAQAGMYGTQRVAATSNVPGTRKAGVAWTDKFGNLWLFGGDNFGSGPPGKFNDLWEYQP